MSERDERELPEKVEAEIAMCLFLLAAHPEADVEALLRLVADTALAEARKADYLDVAESRRRIEEVVTARRTRDEALAALAERDEAISSLMFSTKTLVDIHAARLAEKDATIQQLKREIGLVHERLDELDEQRPLDEFVPDLVDETFRKLQKAESSLAALRAELEGVRKNERQ